MPTPLWEGGRLYLPGDLVRPTSSGAADPAAPDNPFFDEGNTGWTATGSGSFTIDTNSPVFNGAYSAKLGVSSNPNGQALIVTNDAELPVVPGQIVTLRCYINASISTSVDESRLNLEIQWMSDSFADLNPTKLALDPTIVNGHALIDSNGYVSAATREVWTLIEVEGIAPVGAAWWTPQLRALWGDANFKVDYFSYEYASLEAPNNNLYRAVQAAAGFSGNVEPDWPTTIGATIVDNEVTWECVAGTSVTWEAQRILVSACPVSSEDVEPTWPLQVNASVPDGSIAWSLNSRRVDDEHIPQDSEVVLIAASKVYAADVDIIPYSATVNPLDWSTVDDAGYLPFGLQVYGSNPITAMGLYRGNIAAFNSQGCQIWQVDEDPAAITFLDALPIPCTYPKSLAPVGDDLALLTNLGIRSLAVAGAQVNLAGGYFGKQVDPLVVEAIAEALEEGWTPRGLYWPAHGQYMLFFGPQAFVLTINGPSKEQRSWSRYTFPWAIDAWTILGTDLYLRAGDLVERFDPDVLVDDLHDNALEFFVTVDVDTGTSPDTYGYDEFNFGSVTPTPIGLGTGVNEARILILETYNGWTEFFMEEAFAQTLPAEYITMRLETAGGDIDFDLTAPDDQTPWYYAWNTVAWGVTDIGEVRTVSFLTGDDEEWTPFESAMQWPYLDMGSLAQDKELIGFDLSIDGECTVSFGYDQRFTEYDVAGPWTAPYAVDGDTMPGSATIAFSLTSNAVAMRLVFPGEQAWKWYSASMTLKDLTQ